MVNIINMSQAKHVLVGVSVGLKFRKSILPTPIKFPQNTPNPRNNFKKFHKKRRPPIREAAHRHNSLCLLLSLHFLVVLGRPRGVELAVNRGDEVGQRDHEHRQGTLGVTSLERGEPEENVHDVFGEPQGVRVVEVEHDHDRRGGADGQHQGIPQWVRVVQRGVRVEHAEPEDGDDGEHEHPTLGVEVAQLGVEVFTHVRHLSISGASMQRTNTVWSRTEAKWPAFQLT